MIGYLRRFPANPTKHEDVFLEVTSGMMHRTLRNLMDGFLQHLASKRTQLNLLYKSQSDLDDWLRLELYYCFVYLRYLNKYWNLLGDKNEVCAQEPYSTQDGERADVLIRGKKPDIWIKLGCFSTEWDLKPHLETIKRHVGHLSALSAEDTRLLLELMIARGKWAHRTIDDCISRIQDTCGIHFEGYTPHLILTLHNEYRDPLEENIVLKLFFGYVI